MPSVFEPFGAVVNEALLCGDYVMLSSIAGSTCLVNESNGEIIDIKDEFINFDKVSSRIPCLSFEYIASKQNMMAFSYEEYIHNLIRWIEKC